LRTLPFLLLSSFACAGHAQNPRPGDPRRLFLDETRGQAGTFNYDSVLNRALAKDSAALVSLFRLSGLDGAGAQSHSDVLWALLFEWGDGPYAIVLRAQTDSVRARIICDLDYAAERSYARQFPVTFNLAPHNPNCQDWQ